MEEKRRLIDELLQDPETFEANGRTSELLNAYFQDDEIESLKPLLLHSDSTVKRCAAFITSELGSGAGGLIEEVVVLACDQDPRIRWCALESIALCQNPNSWHYVCYVAMALEDTSDSVRRLAMRLLSKLSVSQLYSAQAAFSEAKSDTNKKHLEGLELLQLSCSELNSSYIDMQLKEGSSISRKYAAVALARCMDNDADIPTNAKQNTDRDVSIFLGEELSRL